MLASVRYPEPANFSLSAAGVKPSGSKDVNGIHRSYCSNGRQVKNLTLAYSFISPKNPSGWPINEASDYLKKLNRHRKCLSYKILARLGEKPNCQAYYGDLRGRRICAPTDDYHPLWFIASDKTPIEIERELQNIKPTSKWNSSIPVFVITSSGKMYGFHLIGDGSNSPDVLAKATGLFGENVKSAILADVASLLEGFTILEPAEFQREAYGEKEDDNTEWHSCLDRDQYLHVLLGLDDQGNMDVALALQQRSKIWERYLARFSKIKESVSSTSSQITNVQVSLDLNGFCKYGRSLEELKSK